MLIMNPYKIATETAESRTKLLKNLKLIKFKQTKSLLGLQKMNLHILLVRKQKVTISLHHNVLASLKFKHYTYTYDKCPPCEHSSYTDQLRQMVTKFPSVSLH